MLPPLNSLKSSHQSNITNNLSRETNSSCEENSQYFASSSHQETPLLQEHIQDSNASRRPQTQTTGKKILTDKLAKDCALTITSFLSPKDKVSLLKTNHHTKTLAEDNRNWKHYLKSELLIGIKPGQALELYKNPKNWQDKLVPTNKLGMKYLKRQGPIFSNPFVLKLIAASKLSIENALALTEPPKIFGIFRNPKYRGVENSKGVEKYIDNGKLTIPEALNLTKAQASILDEASVQKYIDKGELTIQQAVARSHVFRTMFFKAYVFFLRIAQVSCFLIIFGIPSVIIFVVVAPTLILMPPFLFLIYYSIKKLFSPYPLSSVMCKIGLHLPGVQKYTDRGSISMNHLITLSENPGVRNFNPENLSLKSIQDRIDKQQLTVSQAIDMSRMHAYWREFKYYIRNIF